MTVALASTGGWSGFTCALGGIGKTTDRGARHNFAPNVAILIISGTATRLAGFGQAGHNPPAAGCIVAAKGQVEGSW